VILDTPSFWSGSQKNLKNLDMRYYRKCFSDIKMFSKGEISEQEMIDSIIESREDYIP